MWLDRLLFLVIGKESVIPMNGSLVPGPWSSVAPRVLAFQGLSSCIFQGYFPGSATILPRPNVIVDSAGAEGETSGGSSPFTAGTCTRSSKGSVIPFMHDLLAFDFNSAPLVWPRYALYDSRGCIGLRPELRTVNSD